MTQFKTARAMRMAAVVVALVVLPATPGAASPPSSSPSTPPPVPDELSAPAQIRAAIEALAALSLKRNFPDAASKLGGR